MSSQGIGLIETNSNINNILYIWNSNIDIPNDNTLQIDTLGSYANYKFKNGILLPIDSSSNSQNLLNYGGQYILDDNKDSLYLQTSNYSLIPSNNWTEYSNLTISGWFKTSNLNTDDEIFSFGNTFYYDVNNLTNWYKFDNNFNDLISSYNLTASGNALLDTTTLKRGNAAVKFDSTAYLQNTSFSINNGDFSFSFWVKAPSASTTNQILISFWKNNESFSSVDVDNLFITKPPYVRYSADNWDITNNKIYDTSGSNRDSTAYKGTISYATATGNGATVNIPYIYGSTTAGIQFPTGSIPATFTICSITRYTGSNYRRIFDAVSGNWLHGHWANIRGVCYYEGWVTGNTSSTGTLTDWLVCCGKNSGATPNNILFDSVAKGTASGGTGNRQLSINYGASAASESSDWAFSECIVWDQALTDAEMLAVSTLLQNRLSANKNVNEIGVPLFSVNIKNNSLVFLKTNRDYITSTNFANNDWKHVTVTHTNTTTKLYVNGVEVGNAGITLNKTAVTKLKIGGNLTNNTYVDDFKIYNKALSPEEVRSLAFNRVYKFYNNTDNMLSWYKFNYDTTNMLLDSSGSNNTLTNVNCTFNNTDYKVYNGGIAFTGSSYLQIANDGRFSPDNITITCWIKFVNTGADVQAIASCRNYTTRGYGWIIYMGQTNTSIIFQIGNSGGWSSLTYNFPSAVTSSWIYITCTLLKSTGAIKIYINGISVSSGTVTYDNNTGTNLRIGAGLNEGGPAYYVANGTLLNDFRIYNRVLSADEINMLYLSTNNLYNYQYNIALRKRNEYLSFQINDTPVYETSNIINNTWNHFIWNVIDNTSNFSYIKLNNGTKNIHNQLLLTQPVLSLFPPSAMTSNNTMIDNIMYRACAYDSYNENYYPYLAFTRNSTGDNGWLGTQYQFIQNTGIMRISGYSFGNDTSFTGVYLGIDMGQKIVIQSYKLMRQSATNVDRLPKTWKIYATNDDRCWNETGGKNRTPCFNLSPDYGWVQIDYEINQSTYNDNTLFNITNNYSGYRYYALNVNSLRGGANNTSDMIQIGEWYIYGYPYFTYNNRLGSSKNIGTVLLNDFRIHTNNITNTIFDDIVYDKYSLINYNNIYSLTSNENKIISLSKEEYIIDTTNIYNSNNFTISTWIKTENFVNNDIIFEISNNFLNDNTNLFFWYKFDQSQFLKNYGLTGGNYDLIPSPNNNILCQTNDKITGTASANFINTSKNLYTPQYNFSTYFSNAFSISFWLKRKGLNTNWDVIVYNFIQIQRNIANNYYSYNLFGNIGNTNTFLNDYIADNSWNHYVWIAEKSGTATKVTVYKNSTQVYTNTSGTWTTPNNSLVISDSSTTLSFIGNLDDFRIYNRVLTTSEINILYNLNNSNTISLKRNNNLLSFQINQIQVYQTPYIDNKWNHILWNIYNNNSTQGFVKINNGNKNYFNEIFLNTSNNFIRLPIGTLTANTSILIDGIYTASSSSSFDSTSVAFRAFNYDNSTNVSTNQWISTGTTNIYNNINGTYSGTTSTIVSGTTIYGEWLQIQLPYGIILNNYNIYTTSSAYTRGPKDFRIAASNDGIIWTLIDTENSITSYTSTGKSFTISNNYQSYSYYRLIIISNNNDTTTGVQEWELYGFKNTYITKLGSVNNTGDLYFYNYNILTSNLSIQTENDLYNTVIPPDYSESIRFNNIKIYPDKIKVKNKDYISSNYYLDYDFKPTRLALDNTTNIRSLNISSGITYVNDYNRNAILLKNGQDANFPNENWMNYNDLTISSWFKSDRTQNGDDIILEMTTNITGDTTNIGVLPKNNFFNDITNLYFWYKFDSIDFLKNYGLTGKDYDLQNSSTVIYPQKTDKVYGDASANFIATGGYLSAPQYNFTTYFQNAITISFWLKRKGLNSNWDVVLYNNGGIGQMIIQRYATGNYWAYTVFGSSSYTDGFLNDYTADNVWNHYVWMFKKSGTSVEINVYKNTILVYTATNGTWTPSNCGFVLSWTTGTSSTLIGNLDDFRIYNKTLSSDEINILYYNSGFYTHTANLIAWYKFDGDATQMLIDSSGNNNMLTNNNGVLFDGQTYKTGNGSAFFNGNLQWFNMPTNINPYTLMINNGISFAFWVKCSYVSSSNAMLIHFNDNSADTNPTNYMYLYKVVNKATFNFTIGATSYETTNNYADELWHHITWTITSNGVWTIYIDNINLNVNKTQTIPNATWQKRYIGRGWSVSDLLCANIDDFRIYNRVITASEVYALYSINPNMPNNYLVRRQDNILSFQINNTPIYETPYVNDTWTHFLWNIINSTLPQGYIKINNGSKNYFNDPIMIPNIYKYPPVGLITSSTILSSTYGINSGKYITSASSQISGTEVSYNAFNFNNLTNLTTNLWTSAANYNINTGAYSGSVSTNVSGTNYLGEWLQIQMPISIVLKYYYIYSTISTRWPKNFIIAGSNDGITWYLIDSESNTSIFVNNSRLFTLPNNIQSFSYYRLIVTLINTTSTDQSVSITEWELYGYPIYSYMNKLGSTNNQGLLYLSDFTIYTGKLTPALETQLYTQSPEYKSLSTNEYIKNQLRNINALYYNGSKKIEGNWNGANVLGTMTATGTTTSYFSDMRLKDIICNIEYPLEIVKKINTFKYVPSNLAKSLDFFEGKNNKIEIGVSAQSVQNVLPEVVELAPFDTSNIEYNNTIISKSGQNYLSVSYENMIPLLIESIKDLKNKFENIKK